MSAVSVEPRPSAANPTVASSAVAASAVSLTVNTVALVTFAESMSERTKVFPGVAASSASKSQLSLVQSKTDLTSVPAASIVVIPVPVNTNALSVLLYCTDEIVLVGTDVSIENAWLSARFSPEGTAVLFMAFPYGSVTVLPDVNA